MGTQRRSFHLSEFTSILLFKYPNCRLPITHKIYSKQRCSFFSEETLQCVVFSLLGNASAIAVPVGVLKFGTCVNLEVRQILRAIFFHCHFKVITRRNYLLLLTIPIPIHPTSIKLYITVYFTIY